MKKIVLAAVAAIVCVAILVYASQAPKLESDPKSADRADSTKLPHSETAPARMPAQKLLPPKNTAQLTTEAGTSAVPLVAGQFVLLGDKYGMDNVASDFPAMIDLARKHDPVAVKSLLSALNRCDVANSDVALTDQDYQRKIKEIGAPDSVWARDPSKQAQQLESITKLHNWCSGLTAEHFSGRGELIELGIEMEIPGMLGQYENAARPTDSWREGYESRLEEHYRRSVNLYDEAISRGDSAALLYRGVATAEGRPGVPADPNAALAYLLAFQTVMGPENVGSLAQTRISTITANMAPADVAAAGVRAQQIAAQCCRR